MKRLPLFTLAMLVVACGPSETLTPSPTITPSPTETPQPSLADLCVPLEDEIVGTFAKQNPQARAVFAAAALRDDPGMAGAFQKGSSANRDENVVDVYRFDEPQGVWYRADPPRRWSKPGYDVLYERAEKCGEWVRGEWAREQSREPTAMPISAVANEEYIEWATSSLTTIVELISGLAPLFDELEAKPELRTDPEFANRLGGQLGQIKGRADLIQEYDDVPPGAEDVHAKIVQFAASMGAMTELYVRGIDYEDMDAINQAGGLLKESSAAVEEIAAGLVALRRSQ